jgi:NTE family protein
MNIIKYFSKYKSHQEHNKEIALVLSGGGARGLAHIGAIEILLERGYNITSVAGTSMGALVGGLFAAGKLNELHKLLSHLTRKQVVQLLDFSPGRDHIANGNRITNTLEQLVNDTQIEDLPIAFSCSATDIISGKEKIFRQGSLTTAIRASISIPCFFKPVSDNDQLYVDGSVQNVLPLNHIERKENTTIIAINVCGEPQNPYQKEDLKKRTKMDETEKGVWQKLLLIKPEVSINYLNLATRVARLSIQNNAQLALKLNPPDIYVEIPMDLYGLFEYDKASEIILQGREKMKKALEEYERSSIK